LLCVFSNLQIDPSAELGLFKKTDRLKTFLADIRTSRIYAETENSANLRLNVNNYGENTA